MGEIPGIGFRGIVITTEGIPSAEEVYRAEDGEEAESRGFFAWIRERNLSSG
jgi:hypothetical protein